MEMYLLKCMIMEGKPHRLIKHYFTGKCMNRQTLTKFASQRLQHDNEKGDK